MAAQPTVEPRIVVLSSSLWREELTAELSALGIKSPELIALKVLQRICGRAGWQRRFALVQPLVGTSAEALSELMEQAPESTSQLV